MKWSSKKIEDGGSRKAEVVVDLDKQIEASLKKKNKKYKDYKRNRKLKEVWLCFHNDIYELSDDPARIMNKRDFIGEAWFYLKKHRCKYDRVFFFSENSGNYTEIYNKKTNSYTPKRYKIIPMITRNEGAFTTKPGETLSINVGEKLLDSSFFR
jgi:hypothetical protein